MELKRWDTGEVIFEMGCATFRELVEGSIKAGVSFYRADMSYADMSGANMRDADMRDANMSYANMRGANMRDANMSYANMRGANMSGANMLGADMSYANMSGANMSGANMLGADMIGADMRGANMRGADMRGANMSDAIGNMIELKTLALEKYVVTFNDSHMAIGCQQHTIEEWFGFTDDCISQMDRGALEWWKKWKDFIFTAIEMTKGA